MLLSNFTPKTATERLGLDLDLSYIRLCLPLKIDLDVHHCQAGLGQRGIPCLAENYQDYQDLFADACDDQNESLSDRRRRRSNIIMPARRGPARPRLRATMRKHSFNVLLNVSNTAAQTVVAVSTPDAIMIQRILATTQGMGSHVRVNTRGAPNCRLGYHKRAAVRTYNPHLP
jgi:hypothetical protein